MSTLSYPERTWVKGCFPCITFQHGDTCTELIETINGAWSSTIQVNTFVAIAGRKMIRWSPWFRFPLGHSWSSWELGARPRNSTGGVLYLTHKAPRKRLDPCPVAHATGGHSTANGKHDMQSLRAAENESTSRRRTSVDKGKGRKGIFKNNSDAGSNCL